jgi:hypothetical protein
MEITDEENRVIEILVSHEKTGNAYGEPILAVGRLMKLDEATVLEIVKDLERQNMLVRRMDPLKVLEEGDAHPKMRSWWERARQR